MTHSKWIDCLDRLSFPYCTCACANCACTWFLVTEIIEWIYLPANFKLNFYSAISCFLANLNKVKCSFEKQNTKTKHFTPTNKEERTCFYLAVNRDVIMINEIEIQIQIQIQIHADVRKKRILIDVYDLMIPTARRRSYCIVNAHDLGPTVN